MFYWLHAYYYVQSLSGRAAKLDVIEELRTPDLERELHGDESGRSSSETDEKRQRYCKLCHHTTESCVYIYVQSTVHVCQRYYIYIDQRAHNVLIVSFNLYYVSKL